MKRFEEKQIKEQYVSDFGMTMELFIENSDGNLDQSLDYPLLKIYADERTEEQYLEFSTSNGLIQLPVSRIKSFIKAAEKDVHSEAWFDKNVFNDDK